MAKQRRVCKACGSTKGVRKVPNSGPRGGDLHFCAVCAGKTKTVAKGSETRVTLEDGTYWYAIAADAGTYSIIEHLSVLADIARDCDGTVAAQIEDLVFKLEEQQG